MSARSVWPGACRTALSMIRRSKGRSLAMGLTLAIGVLAITLTIATGEGARRGVEKSFRSMLGAFDVLLVQPGGPAMRGMARPGSSVTTLTPGDVAAIVATVPDVRDASMAQTGFDAGVEANGKSGTTSLFGVTTNWFAIRGDSFQAGAPFTADDERAMARVAVIGSDVARTYFGGAPAVGQHLRVSGSDVVVVGVLAPNGAGPGGASLDNIIDVPFETTRRRIFNRDNIELATLKLANAGLWAETQASVTSLLRERHAIRPPALDDFHVTSPQALIARYAKVDSTLRTAFFWVGFLALAIGGVIVANLMFTAATTRRREIGTRRAVGATQRDILAQFWMEAIIVTMLAAVVGAGIGIVLTRAGASMMRMAIEISWPVTLGAAAATLAIGIVAGYFPARRAAAESPSAALRTSE
jgi:putative ABC transport system permease protein